MPASGCTRTRAPGLLGIGDQAPGLGLLLRGDPLAGFPRRKMKKRHLLLPPPGRMAWEVAK